MENVSGVSFVRYSRMRQRVQFLDVCPPCLGEISEIIENLWKRDKRCARDPFVIVWSQLADINIIEYRSETDATDWISHSVVINKHCFIVVTLLGYDDLYVIDNVLLSRIP